VTRVGIQERRVVTALFADLARSTSLGERLDPEIVRDMVGRFFELARREIEHRGGTVEKFSGDAVMAVFGLPTAHEDDPERAVRAAIAIRDGVARIADDTRESHGIELQARIGIESGEVVVGDPFGGATMATGDAMNVAARLEQSAEPSEIVIGPVVWEQVRDIVQAEPMGELDLKGRDAAVNSWRVTGIAADVGRPRGLPGLEAPLTGRDEELDLLLESARRVAQERKAALFTILGVPGVGKSRLVREATSRLASDGWSILKGRCLPYGEGITYWPVAEMLRELAGIESDTSIQAAEAALLAISPGPDVAEPLATALGARDATEAATAATDSDVTWAFRQLIEHLGATRRQVLIFEDIHWAEPALLDLIEYLVTWTRDTPLLVICPTRPELLDSRPSWGAGRMESARIQLEPLTESESRSMLSAMLTVDDLPPSLRQQVLDRAEGNPLFVEEVVRLLIEDGSVEQRDGRWHARDGIANVRVPDGVEALIRARLDTLPSQERVVLQAAAVVGRVFQRSAVAAISPSAEGVGLQGHLDDAVLRDLITEERSPDREPTFRFRHILIRDVAYGTLPKARRADLHAEVATWLRAWAGPRIDEFAEIEAYHLEQTVALKRELDGRADPDVLGVAVAALMACSDKARARGDDRGALGFAERALALEPEPGEQRLELDWRVLELFRLMNWFSRIDEVVEKVERDAEALGRTDIQGRAMFARGYSVWMRRGSGGLSAGRPIMEKARQLLAESRDDWNLASALGWIAFSMFTEGKVRRAEEIWVEFGDLVRSHGWVDRQAVSLVRRARMRRELGDVAAARSLLSEARDLAESGPRRSVRLAVESSFTVLKLVSGEGDGDPEQDFLTQAQALEELGDSHSVFSSFIWLGTTAMQLDRPADALAYFRQAVTLVEENAGDWPEAQRYIAEMLVELGEISEASRIAEAAAVEVSPEDFATVASLSMVLGRVREAQGRVEEAEALLNKGMALFGAAEYNPWEYELALAEFMLRQGRGDEGRVWRARAIGSASRYGPHSPWIGFVERRTDRAAAQGAAGAAH